MKFFKSDSPSHVAAPFNQFWEQIRYPKQLDRFPPTTPIPDIKHWPQLELKQLSEKKWWEAAAAAAIS